MKRGLPTKAIKRPAPLYYGADALADRFLGVCARQKYSMRHYGAQARLVDSLATNYEKLDEERLRIELRELREQCARAGGCIDEQLLLKTVAALREAAFRETGWRAYAVQVMGVLALNDGCLAEMATGEGKTLSAGIAAALAGFRGRFCHVITVNDYLVRRDEHRLRAFFSFCGLSSGVVTADMPPAQRRQNYGREIVYVTSKEVLADFLRDCLGPKANIYPNQALIAGLKRQQRQSRLLETGLLCAIVDEADSVLVDEAVTPLIISHPRENPLLAEAIESAVRLAEEFNEGEHYQANLATRDITLTSAGEAKLDEQGAKLGSFWKSPLRRWELMHTALVARMFYHRDQHYLVSRGRIVIVDEFTGRPMPQRTWRQGLHQAIEVKEGLKITAPSETVARMSFQRFFRSYTHLAGMTGTASEASSELWRIYHLPVVKVPRNVPCQSKIWSNQFFQTEVDKWEAIACSIAEIHGTRRPILVGTRNVGASEKLAQRLLELGLACQVLNAARLAEEALVIAKAGEAGRITIATNMAGRGTDILLNKEARQCGGLHVIATEPHESGRIDRQLFGRAGRQGDPGSVQLFLSFEDELLQKYLSTGEKLCLGHRPTANVALRLAQRNAESNAYQQRRKVLRMDDWLDSALSFASSVS